MALCWLSGLKRYFIRKDQQSCMWFCPEDRLKIGSMAALCVRRTIGLSQALRLSMCVKGQTGKLGVACITTVGASSYPSLAVSTSRHMRLRMDRTSFSSRVVLALPFSSFSSLPLSTLQLHRSFSEGCLGIVRTSCNRLDP